MVNPYLAIARTPAVERVEAEFGGDALWRDAEGSAGDRLSQREIAFIAARDSFYMATVSQTGWPYVPHRGGPPGFLKVLDAMTLAFADYSGNRQYISLGNIATDDRAALILLDYHAGGG